MFAKLCSAILWLRNLLSLISFILYQSYIYQSYISHISVIYQSYISHISVIYQSYISHMSVIFQSYISPISVIYQLLPQRTFWSQTICTFLQCPSRNEYKIRTELWLRIPQWEFLNAELAESNILYLISVIYQSYISHISVLHQSNISHISVLYQSYVSHISVIYQ